jgi:hypothetical protein
MKRLSGSKNLQNVSNINIKYEKFIYNKLQCNA